LLEYFVATVGTEVIIGDVTAMGDRLLLPHFSDLNHIVTIAIDTIVA
jgi:hypothetical protein